MLPVVSAARGRAGPPWYHRIRPVTWVLLGVMLVASGSLALRISRRAPGGARRVQVQVMNGSGAPDVAQRAAERLRARGLDVVSIGNADSPHYDETLVLLRRGPRAVAREVASALGMGEVQQQLDPTLLVDVTVVLGKDYTERGSRH